MDAVILAGGLGTRLYPLTLRTPKSLLPFLDRPILEYQLDIIREAGCRNVVLASGHMADQLKEYSRAEASGLLFAEETSPLGTGGALANAIRRYELKSPLLVLNGDILCDLAPRSLISTSQRMQTPITITGAPVDDATEFGKLSIDKNGLLLGFDEKIRQSEKGIGVPVNAGIYLLDEGAVNELGRLEGTFSMETDYFPKQAAASQIAIHTHRGFWRDVGTLERYFKTQFDLLGYYLMMGTANLGGSRDDYSLFRDFIYIHHDTQLDAGCDLYHRVILMHGASLGANCVLRNCILLPGARIGSDCRIESALIDSGTVVPNGSEISGRLLSFDRSEPFLG